MCNSIPFHLDHYEIIKCRMSFEFTKYTTRYFELRNKYPDGVIADEEEAREFNDAWSKIEVIRAIRLGTTEF